MKPITLSPFLPVKKKSQIEAAWISAIRLPEDKRHNFTYFLDRLEPNDSICFMSNSNELDINAILRILKEAYPTINWAANPDIASHPDSSPTEEPILIAPERISVALSYMHKSFKTTGDNHSLGLSGTPALLTKVVSTEAQKDDITVISQYQKDLEQAQSLGIPKENCHNANEFFSAQSMKLKKS